MPGRTCSRPRTGLHVSGQPVRLGNSDPEEGEIEAYSGNDAEGGAKGLTDR